MKSNLIAQKILKYEDLIRHESGTSTEPLVDIRKYNKSISTEYFKKDMLDYTGPIIYIRDTLAKKIAKVASELQAEGFLIKIEYGYRHPDVQEKYFTIRRKSLKVLHPDLSEYELDRLTHMFVAVPQVAGHPAGAAIDLTLTDLNGKEINMGTKIANYSNPEKIVTFASDLSLTQVGNRKILHDAMVRQGFAPFYGEWWHFSYGDREWAAFYNKKALYGAINFKTV